MAKKIGRKKVDKQEKVVPATIYVKKKNKELALSAMAPIAARYR